MAVVVGVRDTCEYRLPHLRPHLHADAGAHATRLRAAFGSELELEQQADYVYVNKRNRGWWGNWADEWARLQQLVCEIAAGRKMLAEQ